MTMTFLAGLAARAGPLSGTTLRPDPWRGKPFWDAGEARPGEIPQVPAVATAPMATPDVPLADPASVEPLAPLAPAETTLRPPAMPALVSPRLPPAAAPPATPQPTVAVTPVNAPMDRTAPLVEAPPRPPADPVTVPARIVTVARTPRAPLVEPRPSGGEPALAPIPMVEPRPREPLPASAAADRATTAAEIEISIGRIEWRAASPPPAPPAMRSAPPTSGFAEYRALRAGLDRGRR